MLYLKIFPNVLTIAASLFLLVGLWFVFIKGRPLAELIAQVAFFYVTIVTLNKVELGVSTLWYKL